MSFSNWLQIIAVGGWLALSTLALAQAPSSEGVSGEGPPIKEQSAQKTDNGNSNPATVIPIPFPIQIIQSAKEEASANDRETKADKHDADDLQAQRKAADAADRSAIAAERQISPAWWQVGIASLGTVLLLYTLWLTRESLRITREAAHHQLRAYVYGQFSFIHNFDDTKRIEIGFKMTNSGETYASRVRHNGSIELFTLPLPGNFELPDLSDKRVPETTIFPQQNFEASIVCQRTFNLSEIAEICAGRVGIVVWAIIDYEDVFKKPHFSKFSAVVKGDAVTFGKLTNNYPKNDLIVSFEAIGTHHDAS